MIRNAKAGLARFRLALADHYAWAQEMNAKYRTAPNLESWGKEDLEAGMAWSALFQGMQLALDLSDAEVAALANEYGMPSDESVSRLGNVPRELLPSLNHPSG